MPPLSHRAGGFLFVTRGTVVRLSAARHNAGGRKSVKDSKIKMSLQTPPPEASYFAVYCNTARIARCS